MDVALAQDKTGDFMFAMSLYTEVDGATHGATYVYALVCRRGVCFQVSLAEDLRKAPDSVTTIPGFASCAPGTCVPADGTPAADGPRAAAASGSGTPAAASALGSSALPPVLLPLSESMLNQIEVNSQVDAKDIAQSPQNNKTTVLFRGQSLLVPWKPDCFTPTALKRMGKRKASNAAEAPQQEAADAAVKNSKRRKQKDSKAGARGGESTWSR